MISTIVASTIKALKQDPTFRAPAPTGQHTQLPPEAVLTVNDMSIRDVARSDAEMSTAQVQISCHSRGSSTAEKKKICKHCCGALEVKFSPMDFGKLVDGAHGEDLGTMVLARQSLFAKFKTWCDRHDVTYILDIPITVDFTNPPLVAFAPPQKSPCQLQIDPPL